MDWGLVAVLAIAMVGAACLQSSIGFGMGMVLAPLMSVVMPSALPGSVILTAVVLTTFGLARERAHLDLRDTGWALVGRVPGTLVGVVLIVLVSKTGLAWIVAAAVAAGLVLTASGWRPRPSRVGLAVAGATSGVMGTATSIGGPPMALIWQGRDGPQMRSAMSAFFLLGSLLSLAGLAIAGAITREAMIMAAVFAPAAIAGHLISHVVIRVLDARRLRIIAFSASTVGLVLLLASILLKP